MSDDIISLLWLIVFVPFFGVMLWNMRKTDKRFDNPERDARERELHELRKREVAALEAIATSLVARR